MFIVLSSVFVSLCVSLLVFIRNPSSIVNKSFLGFILGADGWVIFVHLLNNASSNNLLFFRLAFVCAAVMTLSMVFFSKSLIGEKITGKQKVVVFLFAGFAATLPLTSAVISEISITYTTNGDLIVEPQRELGYLIVVSIFMGLVMYSLINLLRKRSKLNEVERSRVNAVLLALSLASLVGIVTNIILPNLTGNTSLTQLAPIAVSIVSVVVAYSIVRHKLFDIKLVLARSLAYFFALITFAAIYAALLFSFGELLLTEDQRPSTVQLIIAVGLAVALAFTLQPLKKYFDSITIKFFYLQSYDTQEFFDRLNNSLVSALGTDGLKKDLETVMTEEFRIESFEIEQYPIRAFHTENNHQQALKNFLINSDQKIADLSQSPALKQGIIDKSISLIAKLRDQNGIILAFMMFGSKKNGRSFTPQEIKMIDIMSDEIAIALQNSLRYEEIKQFSESLERQVQRATKELRDKNARLKDLDRAKDDFISMASHQLRTPLTTIKGYLSMLAEGDFGNMPDKQQSIIDLAYTSSERMVYLIADLLNVSRITTGKFVIEKTQLDLASIVSSEAKQLGQAIKAKNQKISVKIPNKFPSVVLDETKTRQVIMNLIDNSIYYTPQGGKISVELKLLQDSFEFVVKDSGIGVPKNQQQGIFTKFFRADNAKSLRPDGTGLGLYMAQKVIKDQGGTMIFESTEGKGSTFGFRFSLAAAGASKEKTN